MAVPSRRPGTSWSRSWYWDASGTGDDGWFLHTFSFGTCTFWQQLTFIEGFLCLVGRNRRQLRLPIMKWGPGCFPSEAYTWAHSMICASVIIDFNDFQMRTIGIVRRRWKNNEEQWLITRLIGGFSVMDVFVNFWEGEPVDTLFLVVMSYSNYSLKCCL